MSFINASICVRFKCELPNHFFNIFLKNLFRFACLYLLYTPLMAQEFSLGCKSIV